jgi:hypothetical protein
MLQQTISLPPDRQLQWPYLYAEIWPSPPLANETSEVAENFGGLWGLLALVKSWWRSRG